MHQLKKQGFKIAAIARKCNLSRTTVYDYLERDYEEVYKWCNRQVVLNTFCSLILNTFCLKQCLTIFNSMTSPFKMKNFRTVEEAI
ncbi:terminase gpP N-terminus-related DNA-binding protein [Oceanobacillus picturae]|uniref:terminase gpP N-terminus-related DNA-binding protein n=1 Tax=Oceanobacillus picturae TaxID=171693 RepID=UPI001EE703E2|nr:helix-turn-helix domain-containing protein [Oceanobacillus picturae]